MSFLIGREITEKNDFENLMRLFNYILISVRRLGCSSCINYSAAKSAPNATLIYIRDSTLPFRESSEN